MLVKRLFHLVPRYKERYKELSLNKNHHPKNIADIFERTLGDKSYLICQHFLILVFFLMSDVLQESSLKSQKKPLLEYENTESTTSSDMSVLKITLCCKIKLVRHT